MRSISAKSLGSLTRGLGEATFPDLRPWLIDTLRSEGGNSVERSGAAQGLSELLVASGAQLTEKVIVNEIRRLGRGSCLGDIVEKLGDQSIDKHSITDFTTFKCIRDPSPYYFPYFLSRSPIEG